MQDTQEAATEQVVEQQPPTASLAVFDPIKAGLAEAKKRYANVAFDLKTTKGNDEARKARKELVSLRTGIEKAYTTWNQPLLERQREARELKEQITKEVEALEKPIDEQIKADEKRRETERLERERIERERVAAIRKRIDAIFALPAELAGSDSAGIIAALDVGLPMLLGDKPFFEELQGEAEAAASVVEARLSAMRDSRLAAEAEAERQRLEAERLAAERAELERLRAEAEARAAAERAEIERQRAELAAQQEAARKEAERIDAERQAAAAAEAARAEAERAAAQAAEQARQAAIAEEARKAHEARQAAEREAQERIAAQQRELDEQRARFEREQAAARAAQEASSAASVASQALVRTEAPGLNGSTVVRYVHPATPAPAAEPVMSAEEPPKPELRTQEDAFAAERQAAAERAAELGQPAVNRPADERITAAVAKAFGVDALLAAEWLGTYDALAEINRIQESSK